MKNAVRVATGCILILSWIPGNGSAAATRQASGDNRARLAAVAAKARSLVKDEGKLIGHAILSSNLSGMIEFETPAENLKPEISAAHPGFPEGMAILIRVNPSTLDYLLTPAPPKPPPALKGTVIEPTQKIAHGRSVLGLGLAGSGQLVSRDDLTVKGWDLTGGKIPGTPTMERPFKGSSTAPMALSPDGRVLAIAGANHELRVLSWPDLKQLHALQGHTNFIRAIAFSPDGRLVASGAQDSTIRVWTLPDGRPLATLTGHSGYVGALAFSHDGAWLASGGNDESLRLWSMPEGRQQRKLFQGEFGNVYALAYLPGDQTIVVGTYVDHALRLVSTDSGKQVVSMVGHDDWPNAVAVSADGRLLASAAKDVKVWSLPDGKLIATLNTRRMIIRELRFTLDDQQLVVGAGNELLVFPLPGRPGTP